MKRIIFLGCFAAANFCAKAQSDTTTVDSMQTLAPVEVRSTRVNEKAPFAAATLNKKEIAKQNLGQNFPYFLSQMPSVVTSSDDGVGVGYSSMRIRGTDITRINVTFNGIPVNDPESQGTFFVNTPDIASSTSSVQVQRGVGSSTNGSGAFGASVNIYNIEQSKVATASASNSFGSFNTWKHTLQAATGLLKGGFQFDVRLSKLNSDGYIQRSGSDLKSLQFTGGWTSKNDMTNIKFNMLTGKEKTGQAWNGIGTIFFDGEGADGQTYQQQLSSTGRRTNTLGKMADGKYYNDQTDNYQQDYYQLFLNHKFNPYWSSNLSFFMTRGRGYYNEYRKGDTFSDYYLPDTVTIGDSVITKTNLTRQLWLDNYYYGTVFSANYNKQNTILNFGGAYTQYDAKHYGFVKWAEVGIPLDYRWYNLTAFKNDFNIYGKLQQQIVNGFFAFVDLQLRHVNYNLNGFRKDTTLISKNPYTFFNPKLGLSYIVKHSGLNVSKVFASWAVANREPNRDDFEAGLNNRPKHETLQDFEVGYQYSSPQFDGGVNGYYMKYKNQLIQTGKINDVGAYARTNVDDSYRAGIELTTAVRPANWVQLSANATFSRNKIKSGITLYGDEYVTDENGIAQWVGQQETGTFQNTDISFSPNVIAGGTVTFEPFYKEGARQHFYIDFVEKYVGRQYLDNSSGKLKSINPFAITDARLRYQIATPTFKDISLIFMVNNIFNKKYENSGYTFSYLYDGVLTTENYYYPQAGTNFNVGLSFTL